MLLRPLVLATLAALLAACGTAPPAPSEPPGAAFPEAGVVRLRCEGGPPVLARFGQDKVQVEGLPQGPELLLRDAGGTSPSQSVFSGPRLRAEFGLGAGGREVLLHPLQPPAPVLRCARA